MKVIVFSLNGKSSIFEFKLNFIKYCMGRQRIELFHYGGSLIRKQCTGDQAVVQQ